MEDGSNALGPTVHPMCSYLASDRSALTTRTSPAIRAGDVVRSVSVRAPRPPSGREGSSARNDLNPFAHLLTAARPTTDARPGGDSTCTATAGPLARPSARARCPRLRDPPRRMPGSSAARGATAQGSGIGPVALPSPFTANVGQRCSSGRAPARRRTDVPGRIVTGSCTARVRATFAS